MFPIKILVVADGNRFTFEPPDAKTQSTEGLFTINQLVLNAFAAPAFSVSTAHRRGATIAATPAGGSVQYATIAGDFLFTSVDLSQFDVLWLMADEGYNDTQLEQYSTDLTDDENIAIATFMQNGGGVFAVGDHDGIGAAMCGNIPRVRTMRMWYEAEHPRAGFPSNWSTGTIGNPPRLTSRNDTLRPDSGDGKFYFYDQSDPTPQPLTIVAPVHSVLEASSGTISQFPDHMHQGEAIGLAANSPFLTAPPIAYNGATLGAQNFTEFPTVGGHQERPTVICTNTEISNHQTIGPGGAYVNVPSDNPPKTTGAVSVYDGYNAGVGRVITGATFHHYLDINLIGDPTTASTVAGVGPTGSNLGLPHDVLNGMLAFYSNAATWLARPIKNCSFWMDKSTFGFDEVSETKAYPNAFWVVLDGFSPIEVGGSQPSFASAFATLVGANGITVGAPILESGVPAYTPQRILFPCSIKFPGSALSSFPMGTAGPIFEALTANITINGSGYSAETLIELIAGADPYFANIDPMQDNVFWLSRDLRVFTVTPGTHSAVIASVSLSPTSSTVLDPTAGYTFIEQLITKLNGSYTDASGPDPFNTVLPGLSSAYTGDSSVTPKTGSGDINYNFAVARVRVNAGSVDATAINVRVFFRMFLTQSSDTDFQPITTYLSNQAEGLPASPLADAATDTIPFFASGNYPGANDYSGANINSRSIHAPAGKNVWAYYGCFLNVYDPTNMVNGQAVLAHLVGTHHCIIAEIAFDGAPIQNSGGVTMSPENSDKLAQRNLQVTLS